MNDNKELIYYPTWVAGRKGYAERVRQIFQEYLKKKDLLSTPQRFIILDHLLRSDRHLSQDEIYKELRDRGIGKITVFRTLKILEECRLVEKVTDSSGKQRYEVEIDRPHHDHLICLKCGTIIEMRWSELEKIQEKVSKKIGFTITSHRHELYGVCKKCNAKPG